jgi:hypothetical protein
MRAAIDSLLQYILCSICIQLAGDSAGGTLWLRDNPQQGLWLRSVVRNGRVLRTKEMRRIRVHRLQLFAHELPDSGQPACCAGHGMKQWLSSDVRAVGPSSIAATSRALLTHLRQKKRSIASSDGGFLQEAIHANPYAPHRRKCCD